MIYAKLSMAALLLKPAVSKGFRKISHPAYFAYAYVKHLT